MTEFLLLVAYILVVYAKQVAVAVGSGCMLAYCATALFSIVFLMVGGKRH